MNHPTKAEFEQLLGWLASDDTAASAEYEQIRSGLSRFFKFRGCADPLTLSDETINRVAKKLNKLELKSDVNKISIFYGFAYNIYREYLRNPVSKEMSLEFDENISQNYYSTVERGVTRVNENIYKCLDKCLDEFSEEDRELVTKYYSKDKSDKIELRKSIADKMGVRLNTLHVRVFRLKQVLAKCVKDCAQN